MVARKKTIKKRLSITRHTKKLGRPRKRPVEESSERSKIEISIQAETIRGVLAVLSIALSMFFILVWFGYAGMVGNILHIWLTALFGVGYILVPIAFVMIAIILFRSLERSRIGTIKIVGTAIFFFSSLAFIETLFPDEGGLIGKLISVPLVYSIDTIATVVVLLALVIISLLITFDTHLLNAFPTLARFFNNSKDGEDQVLEDEEKALIEKGTEVVQEEAGASNHTSTEIPTEEKKQTSGARLFRFGGDDDSSGAMFNFATVGSGAYKPPPLSLLSKDIGKPSVGDVKASANTIKRTLQNFGINVEMDEVSIGPTVTRYAIKPAEGVLLAKIMNLQSNLELSLATTPIRIEAPIPGKSLVGIEVPNTSKTTIGLATLLSHGDYQKSEKPLLVALGRDITGKPHYANIAKMPHLLIAGATGAGKSVTVHDIIMSLLYRKGPQELRMILVDPKRVELTLYNDIPHLLTPVVTSPKKAILALKWLAKEMDRRYDILETEKVRDIDSYHKNIYEPAMKNAKGVEKESLPETMPYIVIVIDEMADLMTAYPRELETAIVRLAQMSRAVGIHLILSTQRPSVKIITGLIKANIPSRLALQVSSQIDSRTILDMGGAEKLLGAGDMLFLSGEMSNKPRRIQAPYVSEEEVKAVVKYLTRAYSDELPDEIDLTEIDHDNSIFSSSVGGDSSDDADTEDALYEEAKEAVLTAKKGSTSFLQRKLRIGYSRAARLIDTLEERGVVSQQDGSKAREILAPQEESQVGKEEPSTLSETAFIPNEMPTALIDDTEPSEESDAIIDDESNEIFKQ